MAVDQPSNAVERRPQDDDGDAPSSGVAAGGGAAAGVSALRAYLEGLAVTGKSPATLRAECQRRGLKMSGTKPEMVERVEAHAIANRGGYRCYGDFVDVIKLPGHVGGGRTMPTRTTCGHCGGSGQRGGA
jgi:hypothetical protein